MRSLKRRNKGFTVLELLLAAVLGVVVLGGAYVVYEAGWSTVGRSERRADLQQNARAALDMLVWQIRLAGYQNLAIAPDRIVIADTNLLVIRGDGQVNAALNDTLFTLQPPGTGVCPNLPRPPATPLPCLVRGINVYSVSAGPLANYAAVAFNAITGLTFTYFDRADVPLLPVPLDGVAAGDAQFTDGTVANNPLPGPNACPASPMSQESCRNSVRRIRIVLTAVDATVTAGPGVGSEPLQPVVVTADVRVRNVVNEGP